ncbi:hypothetical protein HUG10_18180 [Halorarum halophilum]|uniref:Small CPxCG-related zinc finger protein n=1 Tax=Halorarum halophilum TaxID=2743090 RepID=A0A7D5KPC0_9EURY|nr:DUF6276 family protein [Halobaculum halophilum]QLG29342.1 hypothetical protein HUG10_18180 [Halobaculum halophilum]
MPTCPHCEVDLVVFAVPESLREHAPDGAAAAAICPRCLRVTAADANGVNAGADTDAAFGRVDDAFPRGEGGVAFALLLGKLPKLTLEKPSIAELRERAESAGVDVALTLDRLVGADVEPHFELDRRVSQLDSLLG